MRYDFWAVVEEPPTLSFRVIWDEPDFVPDVIRFDDGTLLVHKGGYETTSDQRYVRPVVYYQKLLPEMLDSRSDYSRDARDEWSRVLYARSESALMTMSFKGLCRRRNSLWKRMDKAEWQGDSAEYPRWKMVAVWALFNAEIARRIAAKTTE